MTSQSDRQTAESPAAAEEAAATPARGPIVAWAVHGLTASGALAALMSIAAILDGQAANALIWLGVAMVIDGIDGPLARRYRVAKVLPRVDGAILDHVIDYLTYAVIPAVFIYHFELLPQGLIFIGAGFVLVTSLYCFANKDMKTKDNFFSGFPAAWNLVILYFHVLGTDPWINLVVVLILGVLTFVPMKFVHPFRVRFMRRYTLPLIGAWSALSLYLVLASRTVPDLQTGRPAAFWPFVAISFYFAGISLWRSWQNRVIA